MKTKNTPARKEYTSIPNSEEFVPLKILLWLLGFVRQKVVPKDPKPLSKHTLISRNSSQKSVTMTASDLLLLFTTDSIDSLETAFIKVIR